MSDKDYSAYSDTELVEMSKGGDFDAEEYLINKYSYIVRYEIRFLYIVGAEVEDLMQEGMIGLFSAIRSYDLGSKAKFSTFATTCIRNRVNTFIKTNNREKHIPLNTYISIYSGEDEEDEVPIYEQLIDESPGPEEEVIESERFREMYAELDKRLSHVEGTVAKLYISGRSRAEIAEAIGKDEKSVNNALTRIRNKLKGNN
ncbi:MAG: sigma-70 family RNA polymerase sigma factor [Eubacterium sp.]|nr:sigma-70 family RNA polymerase sigma factor [Eubacterium sp.]